MDIDLYKKKLRTLYENEKRVPRDVLKTTYAGGYRKLKLELASMTNELIRETMLTQIRVAPDKKDETLQSINKAIQDTGIRTEIKNAVFVAKDYNEIMRCVRKLCSLIEEFNTQQGEYYE